MNTAVFNADELAGIVPVFCPNADSASPVDLIAYFGSAHLTRGAGGIENSSQPRVPGARHIAVRTIHGDI